jgi:HEAT repeat protein
MTRPVRKAQQTVEEELGRVRAIADAPEAHDLKRELAPLLRHKSNHVIAAAANAVGRLQTPDLVPDLQSAFQELMKNPAKLDPACKALIAIVKALIEMDSGSAAVYFAGLRHVQLEASFGPSVDVAAPLRGLCARGLARLNHPQALDEIVDLLADPEIPARAGAVQALAETGTREAELLLRLTLLRGEKNEVMSEALSALLNLAPRTSVEFVGRFLARDWEELREAAALALGESRQSTALPILQQAYEAHRQQGFRRTLLLSIALLRLDEGVEFLLSRLEKEPESLAMAALDAVALYSRDETIRQRVEAILEERDSANLRARFASASRGGG